ncbi:nuclear transport factor 2 family protein [Trinickia violacea]|uniref:Nuclear transport factor 2 family protein n=1 Tax=Trinickia violacea TaxID=2571746 RepID=A0A4P8ITH0_9BURK|nr:nuclear transport factor 2 family protein [Trinickia violacea]QCP50354.1 nuclear transport factor 2 family protein [Trinickia violacea]
MSTELDKANAAVMKRFYDAVFSSDWAAVETLVSKNLIVYEADGMPYRGEYRGFEELKTLVAKVMGYWDDLNIEVKAITSGGGYVVGVLQFSGTSKSTGSKISMPIAEITEFDKGLISSIKPVYWDTTAISAAITA